MKSSILYLHSPTVRPKDIVRLSGDPLIQDSLSGSNEVSTGIVAKYCLRHCKAGSSSEYITEEFEYEDSVKTYKISSTYRGRENNIFANPIC